MKSSSIGAEVWLEGKDYFFVKPDDNGSVQVLLTSGNRRPLKIRGITRRTAYNLIKSLQTCLQCQLQMEAVDVIGEPFEILQELLVES